MDQEKDDGKTRSRFAKHLQLLDLEKNPGLSAAEVEAERQLMARMPLPPLPAEAPARAAPSLFERWRRSPAFAWRFAGGALVAAMLSVFLYRGQQADDPGWRVKGGVNVEVHVEKDGNVTRFEPGKPVENGMRVQVSVRAPDAARAYLLVRTRAGVAENAVPDAIANALTLAPGEAKSFPGSFELEGENDAETLVVVVCAANHAAGTGPEALSAALIGTANGAPLGAFQDCKVERVQLR